ncbi:MAG TPA: glutathione S-transferase [Afifellaceae bacterium]|nr:glutathione S-transferase [Afifellaceae bacterium]
MKLIDGGRAPNPRRVRIFLAEKGITVPTETVDFMNRAHHTEAFRKINPMQRVPVLILDDSTAIAETVAICRYFEAVQPDPPLFGTGAKEQAVIEMWNRRMELNLLGAITAVFRHLHPAMADLEVPQVPEWAEANKPKVFYYLDWLNGELASREFIAGDNLSIADITAMVAIDFLKPTKLTVPDTLTSLLHWHARIRARPSTMA